MDPGHSRRRLRRRPRRGRMGDVRGAARRRVPRSAERRARARGEGNSRHAAGRRARRRDRRRNPERRRIQAGHCRPRGGGQGLAQEARRDPDQPYGGGKKGREERRRGLPPASRQPQSGGQSRDESLRHRGEPAQPRSGHRLRVPAAHDPQALHGGGAVSMKVFLLAVLFPLLAFAQDFPTKPIRLIVPFGPGGVADITARSVAPEISRALGQPLVIENKPSAGGVVAGQEAARAAPDGYTLLLINNATATSRALVRSLPYEPAKDFAMISTVGFFPLA